MMSQKENEFKENFGNDANRKEHRRKSWSVNVCTVFIGNADFLAILVPLHVPHCAAVSVVYHLLIPNTLQQ